MHSFTLSAALFAAVSAATNIVTFKSLDNVDRTVYITANAGIQGHDPVTVSAGTSVDVELVDGFVGNAYAIHSGSSNNVGMLAEFNFQGWNDLTYFDVSAIINSADVDNVSEMYPYGESSSPVSGCTSWPCNNAYYHADDVQTKSTSQTHLIVTLSKNNYAAISKRETESVGRRFLERI
ncbi:DNAse1 protein [Grosmannia clavigera kw1407]|uniref:DNAse1 protein n=1 Tax=Grosmannia clavigera (strain kw1407 / UAMH 11150) TaxID=655863 RepID=F0XG79_GROCL|nr:DNAse1 protein [Grosmannia clavigera kw1407]EFX02803.1 DNAse1 protein [Grosmannia clavigera kw1407]